jgi:hypothetical protein
MQTVVPIRLSGLLQFGEQVLTGQMAISIGFCFWYQGDQPGKASISPHATGTSITIG